MGQVDVMVLLHNLTQLLAHERNKLPKGMEDQLRWYYNQFEVMLGFLTDNEEMYDEKHLPKEVAELAYRTEDVVDTHYRTYKMANQDQQPFVLKMDHMGNLKKDIEGMMERIQRLMSGSNSSISNRFQGIVERIGQLMSASNSSSSRFQYNNRLEKAIQMWNQSLPRTTRGWVADPEADWIVDNKKDCDMLVDRLINGGPPEELDFIAIQGAMDMIDLVKKVYNDASVRDHFDSRAWVSVPMYADMRNLLLSILKGIMVDTPKGIYEMEEWELKKELGKQLIGIRYLIVLQEVRNCRKLIMDVLPKSRNGSRIILATNYDWLATEFVGTTFVDCDYHFITGKSEHLYSESRESRLFLVTYNHFDDRWKVFCKKIFGEKECPKELEHLGREIAHNSCKSLSLIVRVACILRVGEKTVSRWSNMAAQVEDYYEEEKVLINIFHQMPQHLKTCFLYLILFPLGMEVSVKQLIRLWIAEGLIQWVEEESTNNNNNAANNKHACRMEDVAEKNYLEGLIGLNFIEVTNRRSDGGPKSCRIRPCEWHTYRKLSHGEKFVHLFPLFQWEFQPRRLSVEHHAEYVLSFLYPIYRATTFEFLNGGIDDLKQRVSNIDWKLESEIRFFFSGIRTFSCFDQSIKNILEETWESFFKYTRLLRVLNLEEGEVGKLPKGMEKLFHLRYLSLKPAKNIVVPKSIFNLWNLQTIDLRSTRFSELPKGIWKMQQLRHLYLSGDGPSRLPIPESEDCTLPNLQTLSFISIDPDDVIHISERAPNLRKLGICGYQCFSISEEQVTFNLPHLQTLKFAGECNFEVPITLPDTITKISTLKEVYLQQNVIEMFGKLSNLQALKMVQTSFQDGELVFGKGSFPQLQLLKFEASNIVTWRLEDNTMPNLHHLIINNCPQLTELPIGLWKLNTLQELDLSRASMKLGKHVDDYLKKNKGLTLKVTFPLSKRGA